MSHALSCRTPTSVQRGILGGIVQANLSFLFIEVHLLVPLAKNTRSIIVGSVTSMNAGGG